MNLRDPQEGHYGVYLCVSINSYSFWTFPSPCLGSLDVWLSYNKYQEVNLDSSLLSNLVPKNSWECWWPLKTFQNHQPNLGWINMQRSAPCWSLPWMLSQPCCLPLPSNPLPWETSILSVTSHTAPSASPTPFQAHPQVTEDRIHLCLNASHISIRPSFA